MPHSYVLLPVTHLHNNNFPTHMGKDDWIPSGHLSKAQQFVIKILTTRPHCLITLREIGNKDLVMLALH